jgi:alpha-mannosidase
LPRDGKLEGVTMPKMSLEEIHDQMASYRKMGEWTTKAGRFPRAKRPDFDDSGWDACGPGFNWSRSEGERWFRTRLVVPEEVHGIPVAGSPLDVRIVSLTGYELYVDGKFIDRAKFWFDVQTRLAERAVPGDSYLVALRSPKADTRGSLSFAEWYAGSVEEVLIRLGVVEARARLVRELGGLGRLDRKNPGVVAAEKGIHLPGSMVRDARKVIARAEDYESQILPASRKLEGLTSFLAGHAHIDMNWLWGMEDTIDTTRRTFRSVDGLMDEFPDLIFSQSQAAIYHLMEEVEPEVFEKIRRRVAEGRWDVTASTWVEGDLNMASGESLVRQTTCALNYVEEKFGVTPRVCWCPDTFGHPWTYPQILKKCGLDYYYGHRCTRPENEHLFWWEGPDGSRVLVFNEGVTYNNQIGPQMARSFPKMLREFDLPSHLVVFGVGDHGGGPTRRDLNNSIFLNQQKRFPRLRHVPVEEFYRSVEDSPKIPVVRDELNFVFEGCYTTHSDIKLMNRRGEALLYETEVMSSLASLKGEEYPSQELETAWRHVLFNQFHDLLDGSANLRGSNRHLRPGRGAGPKSDPGHRRFAVRPACVRVQSSGVAKDRDGLCPSPRESERSDGCRGRRCREPRSGPGEGQGDRVHRGGASSRACPVPDHPIQEPCPGR